MQDFERARRTSSLRMATIAMLITVSVPGSVSLAADRFGIGTPVSQHQISGWDITVAPDGKNLPAGSGTVKAGRDIYNAQCASCHGATGEGGLGDRLTGGIGTLATSKPVKTVGSFWPYATTLFDYIRRAMPLNAPQTLNNSEVYAVTGYVLSMNRLLPEDATVDAAALLKVSMPNKDGFVNELESSR
jgi:cytochrome c